MKTGRAGVYALLAVILLANGPSAAQDDGDWDFGEDPTRELSIAAVTFPNFGVAVRCMEGSLSVVLSGLPVASGERSLRYRIGDRPETESQWVSGRDSNSAFAIWPRSIAAELGRGGRLFVTAPDGETSRRFVVDLPPSAASVERVFQACGRELEPPERDAAPTDEEFPGLVWKRVARSEYPERALSSNLGGGLAAITCYAQSSGRLTDCTVESEFPENGGFGRAATLGAQRSARVAAAPGSSETIEGRRVAFVTRFALR